MKIMYDSTRAKNIPADAEYVAGYLDQVPGTGKIQKWSQSEWDRFKKAKLKIRLVKNASTNAGDALDVEERLASPNEAPPWARMRRTAGSDPIVYCNMSTWPIVIREFIRQKVPMPHWWIAKYDGILNLPSISVDGKMYTAFAKQYADDAMLKAPYDKTCFNDWPTGDDMFTDDDRKKLAAVHSGMFVGSSTAKTNKGLIEIEVETQKRVSETKALVTAFSSLLAARDNSLTLDQIEATVTKALQENTVEVVIHGNVTADGEGVQ